MVSASVMLISGSFTISASLLAMISNSSICSVASGKRYKICRTTSWPFSGEKKSTNDLYSIAICLATRLYVKARS